MDNTKHNNMFIMGVPEEKESEQGTENLFAEIMTENSNLVKEEDTQVQEFQSPKHAGPKEAYTKTHHKMTRLKENERILKATREKQVVTYKEVPIRLSSDFSTETFQAGRE